MTTQAIAVSIVAYDGYPLETALESLARLGVPCFEMAYIEGYSNDFSESAFGPENARKLREITAAAGVPCRALSAHFDLSRPDGGEAMRRRIRFAAEIGAQLVSTVSGPSTRAQDFEKNVYSAIPLAEETGVVIGLENPADDSVATISNGADAARIVGAIGHPMVRVNYDPGNLLTHAPGVAPQNDLEPALPWCAGVHLKDLRRTATGYIHTALGEGAIDWSAFFDVLAQSPTMPLLSIEHPLRMKRDPFGRIVLDPALLSLHEIESVLQQSLRVANQQLARLARRQAAAATSNILDSAP